MILIKYGRMQIKGIWWDCDEEREELVKSEVMGHQEKKELKNGK